ncbi:hypothetical protein PLICRDRAFT_180756 [Plicaturopsis crispa FD-325 SS-3]|uniref:Uncharacterized protein n=1 Tax=Plicaturopsis crispa FD-325 SS-3 TaxID=944288 RepID=A0A0C9SPW7_PLICR|nr:hypothetical protein PLICRDRAFT_180756 [Plicaturopsis crispa FD-325 SS-3]
MPAHPWTAETASKFNAARDAKRQKAGLVLFDALDTREQAEALDAERHDVHEKALNVRTRQAWPVDKPPLDKHPASVLGTLVLPRVHRAAAGCDRIMVKPGDDLNAIVYAYYQLKVDPAAHELPYPNYVSADGVVARRHEYLGPQPCVASYHTVGSDIEVEWWDPYLGTRWRGTGSWDVVLEFDSALKAWFVLD